MLATIFAKVEESDDESEEIGIRKFQNSLFQFDVLERVINPMTDKDCNGKA